MKAALSLFAVRLGDASSGVYEVMPSLIATEMILVSKARYDAGIERGWLINARWGRPEEVARVVTTLAKGLLPYTVRRSYAQRTLHAEWAGSAHDRLNNLPGLSSPSRREDCRLTYTRSRRSLMSKTLLRAGQASVG